MIKCNPRAFARCPYKASCGNLQEAEFTAGSDCDLFNQKVLNTKATNADIVRGMSDRELADFLYTITRACADRQCDTCPIGPQNCIVMLYWAKQPETGWNL